MNFLINRRVTISMLFLALTFLGFLSYRQLKVELLPNAELPMLYVEVSYPQPSDPGYVDAEVVKGLEGAIRSIGGVENITTQISPQNSLLYVRFKPQTPLKIATLKLQEKIKSYQGSVPEGFTLSVIKVSTNSFSSGFMRIQALGEGNVDFLRTLVDREITPRLEAIDGVAAVQVYGGREKAVEISLDKEACRALNLTPQGIASILAQHAQEKSYVGYTEDAEGRRNIHLYNPYTSLSDLEEIVIAKGPVRLKDVSTLYFGYKEQTSYSRVNGKEAISIEIVNDAQANLIELSHRVQEGITSLNALCAPYGLEIVVQENSAEVMEENIDQIILLAIVGGILAILILWFFLKNIRLVFFIALSIPISVYVAFHVYYAAGITLNSLTLVGMALAIGMLLDNSVVVLENIYRLSAAGYQPAKAVTQGTKEVWRSIIAATLTTITVFLPFFFSENFMLKLLGYNVGIAIISTLLVSLFVAMLFIPMVTYTILKRDKKQGMLYEKVSIWQRPVQIYLIFLKSCMRHPAPVLGGAVLLLILSVVLVLMGSENATQEVSADRFNIQINMPTGSTLEKTDQMVRMVEESLLDVPERKEVISQIEAERGNITLVLVSDYQKIGNRSIAEIKEAVGKRFRYQQGGSSIYIQDAYQGGENNPMQGLQRFMQMLGVGNSYQMVVVRGSDFAQMEKIAESLKKNIEELDFINYVWVSYRRPQPELKLLFDPILRVSYDVSNENISSGLNSFGETFPVGTSFTIDDEKYEMVIRTDKPQVSDSIQRAPRERTPEQLRSLQIEDKRGGLHLLDELATVVYGEGLSSIYRENQDKRISLYFSIKGEKELPKDLREQYLADIEQLLYGVNLPSGIALELENGEEPLADFQFLLLAALVLIFLILASVFESLVTPFVLLFAIPLAAIGSLLALYFTGGTLFNANTLTGFLILLGVVVNNGIILIDYANLLRKRGYRRNRALMASGLSRIRPILITSVTTIVAMIPMAMGKSEFAGAIGAPFAITVIGGLSCSALLTLLLIPTACMGLETALAWYRELPRRVHLLHLLLFVAGVVGILHYADGFLWQSLTLVAWVVLIPATTWFIRESLRRAHSRLIASDTPIEITIGSLVKIYDRPGRFARQWQGGKRLRRRLGLEKNCHTFSDLKGLLWLLPVTAFCVYLAFFYLHKQGWILLLGVLSYLLFSLFWKRCSRWLQSRYNGHIALRILQKVCAWGVPVLLLYGFYHATQTVSVTVLVALIGGLGIAIRHTSDYLYNNDINVERVSGRFARLKRFYFRLVKSIPLIGKQRRPFKALKGISLEIRTGMFGLLGPNGAGKSTLMRMICGILEPSYGTIWINGYDTRVYREELQSLIGFLPQEFGTYEHLSAWDFLDYQALLRGITQNRLRHERLTYVLQAVHMYERRDEKIGSFSGGMKQRIGIALILLHLPRILVVDEPTAGLDPRERIRFRNLLVELSKERIVIFSTHIIEDISSSCNQVAVVNQGELKYFGDPTEMISFAQHRVWLFDISETDFEALDKALVVNHMQSGTTIRVRYLSAVQPTPDAVEQEPNLEDAYLCLLKNL